MLYPDPSTTWGRLNGAIKQYSEEWLKTTSWASHVPYSHILHSVFSNPYKWTNNEFKYLVRQRRWMGNILTRRESIFTYKGALSQWKRLRPQSWQISAVPTLHKHNTWQHMFAWPHEWGANVVRWIASCQACPQRTWNAPASTHYFCLVRSWERIMNLYISNVLARRPSFYCYYCLFEVLFCVLTSQ